MINATGTPLESFKYDEDGNLSKDAVTAAFKEMKVILGEQLMDNLHCILFPGESELLGQSKFEEVFEPFKNDTLENGNDQDLGIADGLIHSETFNKFIEQDLGLDSEDLATLRGLCGYTDPDQEVNISDMIPEKLLERKKGIR